MIVLKKNHSAVLKISLPNNIIYPEFRFLSHLESLTTDIFILRFVK